MSPDSREPRSHLGAEARTLAELASYQDGAIVSREIVSRPGGSVTLFAFDAGQGLSEHAAPFDAIVYIIEGAAEVTISGRPHTVAAGQLIVMPANAPHALRAPGKFKMMLIMIRP